MSRRRQLRSKTSKPNPYDAAHLQVKKLCVRVIDQLPPPEFKSMDVVEWLWPPDIIRVLKESYEICDQYSLQTTRLETISVLGIPVYLYFSFNNLDMTTPKNGLACMSAHPRAGAIMDRIMVMRDIYREFSKVNKVIDWFGEHATPGATNYYWPTMRCLLPDSHDIHKVESGSFRAPKDNIAPMLPLIRETAGIVAGALLCPKKDANIQSSTISVMIEGDIFDLAA